MVCYRRTSSQDAICRNITKLCHKIYVPSQHVDGSFYTRRHSQSSTTESPKAPKVSNTNEIAIYSISLANEASSSSSPPSTTKWRRPSWELHVIAMKWKNIRAKASTSLPSPKNIQYLCGFSILAGSSLHLCRQRSQGFHAKEVDCICMWQF